MDLEQNTYITNNFIVNKQIMGLLRSNRDKHCAINCKVTDTLLWIPNK